MATLSRLGRQLQEIIATLSSGNTRFALIGGLALAPHRVPRATRDIDLLAEGRMANRIHDLLIGLGYQCLHRSEDAGNYQRGDERVDFIYAHRPAAMRLLTNATARETPFGRLYVVSAEGLIGASLPQPLIEDGGLPAGRDVSERDPFEQLDDLMCVIEALCPTWPARPTFRDCRIFLI